MIQEGRQRIPPKGRVITFYSYKGGTGRSMALANVAWLLAMNGERVLIIDWDLEAPGIHRYFHPLLEDKELLQTEGLLDFVEKLSTRAAMAPGSEKLGEAEVDVIEYVTMLKWPAGFPLSWKKFGDRAGIDLLTAGRQGPLYGKRLNAFNWVEFYEKLDGRRLLSIAREQMRGVYDYVLIDSRTGVSDTSGICTVEMPDTLVVCFTLNDQSITGASSVAHDVLKQREAYLASTAVTAGTEGGTPAAPEVPFRVYPVPTRVEIGGESPKRKIALSLARKKFAPFVEHLKSARSKYWGSIQMAYFPQYAFEEIPAVFGDSPHQQISLLTSIREIGAAITGGSPLDPVSLAEDEEEAERLREEVLSWYLRKADSGAADPVEMAQSFYDLADTANQLLIRRVMLRLVQVGGSVPAPATVEIGDLGNDLEPVARRLADAGILQISGTSVFIADRKVIERWEHLTQWIKEDEAFLLWRQALTVSARSWRQSGKDASALLRGKLLQEAMDWNTKRREDLNSGEREFIDASEKVLAGEKSRVSFFGFLRFKKSVVLWLTNSSLVVLALWVYFFGPKPWTRIFDPSAPAGKYWTIQPSPTGRRLLSIHGSSDGTRLCAVGDNGTILEYGAGWIRQNSPTSVDLAAVFAGDDGSAWAAGNLGTIVRASSVDRSTRWNLYVELQKASYNFHSIFGTSDGGRLWVAANNGAVLISDARRYPEWTPLKNLPLGLISISGARDGRRLWAVGGTNAILDSNNSGETWTPRSADMPEGLDGVFAALDGNRVWAVGGKGTILESADGAHWTRRASGTTNRLHAIFGTSDGKHLWAVGEKGTILESNDDGEMWTLRTSPTTNDLFSVFGTDDGTRVWAVGWGGTILESHGR